MEGCFKDLFKIAGNIIVLLPSIFYCVRSGSVHAVHLFSSLETATVCKKFRFSLSETSDFH